MSPLTTDGPGGALLQGRPPTLLPTAATVEDLLLAGAPAATGAGARRRGLARELRPLAPYLPARIFLSGASYRTHLVQLMLACAAEARETDLEGAQQRATELMRERAENGTRRRPRLPLRGLRTAVLPSVQGAPV